MVAAAATAAWASAVGMYGSVQKRRSTSSKIVVPSEPSGRCSKTTYTPRSQARPSMRRGSMRRCSSSKPSSAPLSDGVTARCAARLASQFNEPFANCVRAASTVKTLSGRKDHSKAVPAWASVTLSVRSAKAGIPAGPARHCAAPGGIGASGSMVGFTDVCALLYGCNTVLARRLAPRGHCALRKFLEKLGCKLADRPTPAEQARLSKHTLTYHSDSGRESSVHSYKSSCCVRRARPTARSRELHGLRSEDVYALPTGANTSWHGRSGTADSLQQAGKR